MRRYVAAVLVLIACLGGPPARAADVAVHRTDLDVVTRDGTTLPAAFLRPADVASGAVLPVVVLPHGGGGRRDCFGDVARAERYARAGFVAILYTFRGHGLAPSQIDDCPDTVRVPTSPTDVFDIFGPLTPADLYDVLHAVVEHPDSHADAARIGLHGYSQGGGALHLAAALSSAIVTDLRPGSTPVEVDPYGYDITAVGPGHTFYDLYRALAPNECLKLSFGAFVLAASYTASGALVDPWLADRWAATMASGSPQVRDAVRPEFALRSPSTYADELAAIPSLWVQAFDDLLFPVDEAVDHFDRSPDTRLWLSWNGHATPATNTNDEERAARDAEWQSWFEDHLLGRDTGARDGPPVTYWYHDPDDQAILHRATAAQWPPEGAAPMVLHLAPGGSLTSSLAEAGTARLVNTGAVQDLAADPIVAAVPMGTMLPPAARTPLETAVFVTDEFTEPTLIAGAPSLDVFWTTTGSEFEVNATLWDVYPDGRRWLVTRGCTLETGTPGAATSVTLDLFHTARMVGTGHRLELWVSPVDQPTFLASHVPSVNDLWFSADQPSRLTLPVVSADDTVVPAPSPPPPAPTPGPTPAPAPDLPTTGGGAALLGASLLALLARRRRPRW